MSIEASTEELNGVRWADATIEHLAADYDRVRLTVTEEGGRVAEVAVFNHIGCRWSGHWDESVIESAEAVETSEWLHAALSTVRKRHGEIPEPGGGTREIDGPWFHLTIRFIDGAEIEVLGQRLEVSFRQGQ